MLPGTDYLDAILFWVNAFMSWGPIVPILALIIGTDLALEVYLKLHQATGPTISAGRQMRIEDHLQEERYNDDDYARNRRITTKKTDASFGIHNPNEITWMGG